jgi:hypothetical protein
MDGRRRITTFGAGATAGALVCAVLTAGIGSRLTGGTADLVGAAARLVRIPSAAANELPAFGDCEQLRQWYVGTALPHVGPWGFGAGPVVGLAERTDVGAVAPQGADKSLDSQDAVGSSGTGTNVQEADVDESDIAKTDGRVVVRMVGDEIVVTDVSAGGPRELSRTVLPGPRLNQPELLLRDDRVFVVGDELRMYWRGAAVDGSGREFLPNGSADTRTHVISVDIGDPADPGVQTHQVVDGGAVSTRQHVDGTVRVVVTTGFPPMDFVEPNRDRSARDALRTNRQIVRSASVDDWLPGMRSGGGARQRLLDCSEVRHPRQASGFGTISVLTFPFDDLARYDAAAVTAAGDLAYSSADRLYVATTAGSVGPVIPMDDPAAGVRAPVVPTTHVHAFALDGDRTTYAASGSFRGTVKDRWSLSEYDGHLRVAAALHGARGPAHNGVLVLEEQGDRLVQTGRLAGLGKGEDIQSVRWFGDLAIVVTFRQIDPLYTVDLSDPSRPQLVGALKIPGFSSYLHPVGGDLLVGVGHDVSAATGADLGVQAATFDLQDLRDVERTDTFGFGPQTDVGVGMDPRTFTYLPEQRILVTPVQDWSRGSSRIVALHVAEDGTLTSTGSWSTRAYAAEGVRTLPLGNGRIALVGDAVRVVDVV